MGLVKTRRLAAMQKQQRAIHLRQGYGGLKAGMKLPTPKPVQFLPAYNKLLEDALAHAVSFDYDGVGARVLPAEYLAAIAVQTGRVKDKLRVQSFLASDKFDKKVFADICMAHGLSCPVGEVAK